MIYLRTSSHRSRERLFRALGRKPAYYFTWEHGGVFAEITAEEHARIGRLRGITTARVGVHDLRRCWS